MKREIPNPKARLVPVCDRHLHATTSEFNGRNDCVFCGCEGAAEMGWNRAMEDIEKKVKQAAEASIQILRSEYMASLYSICRAYGGTIRFLPGPIDRDAMVNISEDPKTKQTIIAIVKHARIITP